MLELIISNSINLKNYTPEIAKTICDVLTIPNPIYEKIKRITGSAWAAERNFKYWKEKDNILEIPRGMRGRLLDYLNSKKIEYKLVDNNYIEKNLITSKMLLKSPLKNYQIEAVEKMYKEREGICEMGTGVGKTLTMLALIKKIGLTACILVPTLPILAQFKREAKDFYGIKVGQIGDGKKELNYDIIISTFQSLSADKELLKQLSLQSSIIILDECQGIPSPERMEILLSFNPKHLFGFTATCLRSDGKTKAIEFLLGKIKHEYAETPLIPQIEVIQTETKLLMSYNYHEIIDDMIANKSRNKLIVGLIIGQILEGRKVLVLTKRIEHYQNLRKLLPTDSDQYVYIESDDKDREEKLAMLNDGRMPFNCIFGTTSLLAVGVNLKACDTLILACDIRCETLTRQAIGRVLRKTEKDKFPLIIDLFDNLHPILKTQYYSRRKVYQKFNWLIKTKWD